MKKELKEWRSVLLICAVTLVIGFDLRNKLSGEKQRPAVTSTEVKAPKDTVVADSIQNVIQQKQIDFNRQHTK